MSSDKENLERLTQKMKKMHVVIPVSENLDLVSSDKGEEEQQQQETSAASVTDDESVCMNVVIKVDESECDIDQDTALLEKPKQRKSTSTEPGDRTTTASNESDDEEEHEEDNERPNTPVDAYAVALSPTKAYDPVLFEDGSDPADHIVYGSPSSEHICPAHPLFWTLKTDKKVGAVVDAVIVRVPVYNEDNDDDERICAVIVKRDQFKK